MSIIDRINAPAAEKMTAGQKIRIDSFTAADVEDTYANDGSTRPQMIIYSDGKAYYAPTPVARKVVEAQAAGEDVKAELTGRTLEAVEYYSNRFRRMLLDGKIV